MTFIRILRSANTVVRLNINGHPAVIYEGQVTDADSFANLSADQVLEGLRNSNVEYELVGEPTEAEGVGGSKITAPSAESAPGNRADPSGVISGPSADSAPGEDVEGGESGVFGKGEASDADSSDAEQRDPDKPSDASRDELLSVLDGNTADVEAALDGLSPGELGMLYKAEKDGKSRKGVIAAIEARFADQGKGDDE